MKLRLQFLLFFLLALGMVGVAKLWHPDLDGKLFLLVVWSLFIAIPIGNQLDRIERKLDDLMKQR